MHVCGHHLPLGRPLPAPRVGPVPATAPAEIMLLAATIMSHKSAIVILEEIERAARAREQDCGQKGKLY